MSRLRKSALAFLITTVTTAGLAPSVSADTPDPAARGGHRVATATYRLGDPADRSLEVAGVVHYPKDIQAGGKLPVVLQLHGSWPACAGKSVSSWPCDPGIPTLPSYRGYDYLGDQLASHGYVVISVSGNGHGAVEALSSGEARQKILNRHLELWRQLSATGTGPLAGKFGGTDFTGRLDLARVGTMGHSMGGEAVMRHASDKHRAEAPSGVEVKAVVALAPAYTEPKDDTLVTQTPFLVIHGTCDNMPASGFFRNSAGKNRAPISELTMYGANHNFFNTQWSPSSGQYGASDDAKYGIQGLPVGQCLGKGSAARVAVQLTEEQQRLAATAYISAFFRRHLGDETRWDPFLSGERRPPAEVVTVDIRRAEPAIQ